MKILIIGGGGREHAMAWKIAQSPRVSAIFVAPGNAGTASEQKVTNIVISAEDISSLAHFAEQENIALTIVGPEAPLVAGIVDRFEQLGLRCFGPQRHAAILEGSKSFTKQFLQRHHIPTAAYAQFSDPIAAQKYLLTRSLPIVIKADGLASGKGVFICQTHQEALETVHALLADQKLGIAGQDIVIEDFLVGEEASFIIVTDGTNVVPLASSQDHKQRDIGDCGPNTGGMGAYSPAPVITQALHERIMQEIMIPTVQGMAQEGRPYRGFLYAGLMIDPDGTPNVLEFNCRLGDPETQPILMRLKTDLVEIIEACFTGGLDNLEIHWDPQPALGVVLAAQGYPFEYRKGDVISDLSRLDKTDGTKIFHAGTMLHDQQVVTSGGRVLCVTSLGENIQTAQQLAYQTVQKIYWEGMFYRTDIGHRAVNR